VTEVGLMLGFADASSFTTSFCRLVGIAPSDYSRSVAREIGPQLSAKMSQLRQSAASGIELYR
jgi:AraC-like DNA-binding protein